MSSLSVLSGVNSSVYLGMNVKNFTSQELLVDIFSCPMRFWLIFSMLFSAYP